MEIDIAVRDLLLMWDALRQTKGREAAVKALVWLEPNPGLVGKAAEYASAECDKAASGFRPELQAQYREWVEDLEAVLDGIAVNRAMRGSSGLVQAEVIEAERAGLRVRLFAEPGGRTYAFHLERHTPVLEWVRVPMEAIRYDQGYADGIVDWSELLLRASTALASAIDRFGLDQE